MKKELRFSSVIDTKEFDRAIADMSKKLQNIYQASDRSRSQLDQKVAVNRAGLGAAPTTQDKLRADQDDRRVRREMDSFIKDQVKNQEQLSKMIAKQLDQKKELSKLAKEDLKAQEKVLDLERQIATNREKMKASQEQTGQALQARNQVGFGRDPFDPMNDVFGRGAAAYRGARAGGAGMFGGMGAAAKGMGRGIAQSGMSGIPSLAGLAGGALLTGAELFSQYNTAPREILLAQSSARNTYGQNARDVLSGNGFERMAYASENSRALKDSKKEIDRERMADYAKDAGKLLIVGASAAAGMALGPMGALAAGAAATRLTGLDQSITSRLTGTYDSNMQQKQAQIYEQNFEARKNLDPVRRAVLNRYQSEVMPNLSAQRATGMGDSELQEGLLTGTRSGFTSDMTRQSMQGILGAGGSTRTARDSATFANRLQRNFNLTNATGAMGRISSLTSSSGQSDSSMVRVLAEAVSLGLDDSEFAEEQRRFVDTTSQIIGRSGAIDGNQQGVAGGFSKFVTGNQMYQVEGAKAAYDVSQRLSGDSGGARGAIQSASIMKDKNLSKLNRDERNMLLQLTDEQLAAGGPLVEGMAASAGLSQEEFVKKAKDMKRGSFSTRADVDKKADLLRKLKSEGREGSEEYKSASSQYLSGMGYDVGEIGKMKPAELDSLLQANVFGGKGTSAEQMTQNELDVLAKSERGAEKSGDKYIAGQAAGDQAFIETMSSFSGFVDEANTNLVNFSKAVVEAVEVLGQFRRSGDVKGTKIIEKNLGNIFGTIQDKGAPPSGK